MNNKSQYLYEHYTTAPEEVFEAQRHFNPQSIIYPPPEPKFDFAVDSGINGAVDSSVNGTVDSGLNGAVDSGIKGLCLSQGIKQPDCYNALVHLRNFYGAKQDLPSIISRSKDHESYRNGCTQRIRACETNHLDAESLSKRRNGVNCERNVKDSEADKVVYPDPTDKVYEIRNKQKKVVQDDDSCYQVQVKNSLQRKRNKTTKNQKNRSPTCKSPPDQFKKINQALKISRSNARPSLVKSSSKPEADLSIIVPKFPPDIIVIDKEPELAETTESKEACVEDCDGADVIMKAEDLFNISVPMAQVDGSTERSVVGVSKTDLENIDEPIVHSACKTSDTTDGVPSQSVNHRVIKFTFQRKRKRSTSNVSDGNESSENSTLKRKAVEKRNDSAEADKSCSVAESSREKRRLAQVARQVGDLYLNSHCFSLIMCLHIAHIHVF